MWHSTETRCVTPRIGAAKLETLVWHEIESVIIRLDSVQRISGERREYPERADALEESARVDQAAVFYAPGASTEDIYSNVDDLSKGEGRQSLNS